MVKAQLEQIHRDLCQASVRINFMITDRKLRPAELEEAARLAQQAAEAIRNLER